MSEIVGRGPASRERAAGGDEHGEHGARHLLRRLLGDLSWQFVAQLTAKASGLIGMIVLSRALGVEGLGTWVQLAAAANLLSMFTGLGVFQAVVQFYPEASNDSERARILRDALSLVLGVGVLCLLLALGLGATLGPRIAFLSSGGHAAFVGAMAGLSSIRLVLLNHLRAMGQLRQYSAACMACELLELAVSVLAAVVFESVLAVAAGVTLSVAASAAALGRSAFRTLGPAAPAHGGRARLLRYGVPLAWTQVAEALLARGDRLLVGALVGNAAAAVYSTAYAMVSVPAMLASTLTTVLFPRLAAKTWGARHERELRRLSLAGYIVVSTLLLTVVTFFAGFLLRTLLGDSEDGGASVSLLVGLTGLGTCFFGAGRMLGLDLFVRRQTLRASVLWTTAAALNLGLNALLLPRFGLLAAGLANALAYLAFLVLIVVAGRVQNERAGAVPVSGPPRERSEER
jgi:O-antigen/teichoic acid export membrane protein